MRARTLVAAVSALVLTAACSSGASTSARSSSQTASSPSSTSASPSISVSGGPGGSLPDFPSATVAPPTPGGASATEIRQFLSVVFTDAQQDWRKVFATASQPYSPARLVFFTAAVPTACGDQTSDVGPFYCPGDQTVYLDVSFFSELEQRYGVKGDFAQAYVVAHELGHHIQTITGLSNRVAAAQQAQPASANALSVLTELQADCYAGVWAHSTYQRGLLEPGDIEEALTAAAAVGDDFLQHAATGAIEPEQWTHGSSAQRQQWLTTGYDVGKPSACNTFGQ